MPSRAQTTNSAPDFNQVYDLVRAHLGGVSAAELNRAAVHGLVSELSPRVALVPGDAATRTAREAPLVSKSALFEGPIAYVRVGRVDEGLARALRDAYGQLSTTNKLKGLTLDLRYAGGENYAAAAAVADLFLKKERPLLNWGDGMVRSKEKNDAINLPVAVLVNRWTAAAAEALAAVLRETGTGLILGNKTAGQAMIAQEFPLADGQRLRVATAPIQLGDGSALSEKGVAPDITVQVKPEEELAYYADAFQAMPRTNLSARADLSLTNLADGTNQSPRRPRFNEAELVRERREGVSLEEDVVPGRDNEAERQVVRDPALARALDLLKGLAVVRESRS